MGTHLYPKHEQLTTTAVANGQLDSDLKIADKLDFSAHSAQSIFIMHVTPPFYLTRWASCGNMDLMNSIRKRMGPHMLVHRQFDCIGVATSVGGVTIATSVNILMASYASKSPINSIARTPMTKYVFSKAASSWTEPQSANSTMRNAESFMFLTLPPHSHCSRTKKQPIVAELSIHQLSLAHFRAAKLHKHLNNSDLNLEMIPIFPFFS